jgi:hypothetical protein
MKSDQWKEIEKIYHAALKLDPAHLEAFLREACAGDEIIRREVERLLEGQEGAEDFIESQAVGVVARALAREKAADIAASDEMQSAATKRSSMPRKRAPWWMCALAAVLLISAGVRYYACYAQPEDPGIQIQPFRGSRGLVIGVMIKSLLPNAAGAKAGLQAGDIVLNWTQTSPAGTWEQYKVLSAHPLYWEIGRPIRFEIRRKQENKTIFMALGRDRLSSRLTGQGRIRLAVLFIGACQLILAVILAFVRPHYPAARWGALFLAICALEEIYRVSTPMG